MSFRVIKGSFHIVGYSPDGDSVRFKADDLAQWNLLEGSKVRLNKHDHAQLRIEAIDTLETHYKSEHQPAEWADSATQYLLKLLGIKNTQWNDSRSRVVSADDGVPGYIITRMAERYGRPVAFVFAGETEYEDGQAIFLDNRIAKTSINFKMLAKGFAYPTFYDGLFYDLRARFAKVAIKARAAKKGVWSEDKTNSSIKIESLSDLTDEYVILPKLFRRLVTYMKAHDSFDAHAFIESLKEKQEKVLVLSDLHFTHFDNLIEIDEKGRIKLAQAPENLVFLS
ncbi:hypothetical protein MSP8886_00678 [Marinomonas spartinae]|uniref:TNase-like domain-containing protein n=1 Tax=Marinomonas spartinae TaxID=1792290 RepID=A0A1A8T6I3_9GAMM|nr:thermonuclease family protein [Marinomonas spartinae]SBS26700.1 hypothetical protein MSP8886_00678 [Marinomonas spartinae]